MTAKNYIIQRLQKVKEKFKTFDPSYYFDKESKIHFIMVEPDKLNNNLGFQTMGGEIISDLMEEYPNESICFINSESLIKIEKKERIPVLKNNRATSRK